MPRPKAQCDHPKVVIHSESSDAHRWDDAEEECGCMPALVCPACYPDVMRQECFVLASEEIVETFRRMGMHSGMVH